MKESVTISTVRPNSVGFVSLGCNMYCTHSGMIQLDNFHPFASGYSPATT